MNEKNDDAEDVNVDYYDDNAYHYYHQQPLITTQLLHDNNANIIDGNDNCNIGMNQEHNDGQLEQEHDDVHATWRNFLIMSILFSLNHGTVVSVLVLVLADSGIVGVYQNIIVNVLYSLSALFLGTYVTEMFGSRGGLRIGMWLYAFFVVCALFQHVFAVSDDNKNDDDDYNISLNYKYSQLSNAFAIVGAFCAGIGGGILWTAQGAHFVGATQAYANVSSMEVTEVTSHMANVFAAIFLAGEIILKALSTTLVIALNLPKSTIYFSYAFVCIVSSWSLIFVQDYAVEQSTRHQSTCEKFLTAAHLFEADSKMKYMIFMPMAFGLSSTFLNSFVGGQAVSIALKENTGNESDSVQYFVGIFSACTSLSAALLNIILAYTSFQEINQNIAIALGAVSYFVVPFLFTAWPNLGSWSFTGIVIVYTMAGIGRGVYEGPLQASYATLFSDHEIGAFANKALSLGISSTVGLMMSVLISCSSDSVYCVQYADGSYRNILPFEILIMATASIGLFGYFVASIIHSKELESEVFDDTQDNQLVENLLSTKK